MSMRISEDGVIQDGESITARARRVTELELEDFARLLGTEVEVVSSWERGTRSPPPIGLRLLELIVARPDVCLTLVGLERSMADARSA